MLSTLLVLAQLALAPNRWDVPMPPPPQGTRTLTAPEQKVLVRGGSAPADASDADDVQDLEEALSTADKEALEDGASEDGSDELATLQAAEAEWGLDEPLDATFALNQLGMAHPLRQSLEALREETGSEPTQPAAAPGQVTDLGRVNLKALQAQVDIPIALRPLVAQYIHFFQTRGRQWFRTWMNRSGRFLPVMQPLLEARSLPKDLVFLAMIESGFTTQAHSRARAAGPWQFMPATGHRYGLTQNFWVDERRDPIKSTEAAAQYLSELYAHFGDWYLTWASYNAGDGRVRQLIRQRDTRDYWLLSEGKGFSKETQHYVPKLIACATLAKNLRAFGFTDKEFQLDAPLEFDEVHLPAAVDLDVLAQATKLKADTLRVLNPELRRPYTPPASPQSPYTLKVPKGLRDRFAESYSKLPAAQKLSFKIHRVRKGDTLAALGGTYRTSADALRRVNGLKAGKALRPGVDLMVPQRATMRELDVAPKVLAAAPPKALRTGAKAEVVQGRTKLTYVVKAGDSLWSISQRFGVSIAELRQWNALSRKLRSLRAGRPLILWPPARLALNP